MEKVKENLPDNKILDYDYINTSDPAVQPKDTYQPLFVSEIGQPAKEVDPKVQKTLDILDYYKMELVQILPQIKEVSEAARAKHVNNAKKLNNAIKKIKDVIKTTK